MSRKKKHQHDEHVDESWLLPYADLLTLLLALFIVLFAASSVDAQKFHDIAKSMNSAMNGGTGIMDYQDPRPEEQTVDPQIDITEKNKEPEFEKQEKIELEELQKKINARINEKNLSSKLKTILTDEGLLITFLDDVLFDPGVAKVRLKDQTLAREISGLLVSDPPRNIIISGHTDNVPINNPEFDSNWHLSVMRAVNFMKIILENKELDVKKLSAKGFGEYQPVATNDTPSGRGKNRRVEVLILPNKFDELQ